VKIGLGIGDIAGRPAEFSELVAQAQRAEASGFASIWFANIFGADALIAATVCGRATTRIEVGTAVVPSYTRHPYTMAQQALSVNAAIGNRLALGIGLSHQIVIETMLGLSYAKSYSHMKDYLAALNPLLRDGKVRVSNDSYRVNARVAVLGAKPPSVLIAALAPKMLGLAGSVADGTVTWMTGPKTLADHTVPSIRQAAAAAGNPAPRIVAGLPLAVTDDAVAARHAAGRHFQVYGGVPSYRAMLDREGAAGPADVAIVGNEAEVSAQLDHLAAIGVTELIAVPFHVHAQDESLERSLALLAKRVG
jgi:5,10-methylenetetrahydromethanopterin reductase